MKLDCEHEQIKQLQSDNAAYREALVKWSRQDNGCCRECSAGNLYTDSVTGINHTESCSIGKALSLTSGKDLLAANTKLKALVKEAEEGLRRTILWAESASMKMVRIEGESINWNYLNDGRNALTAISNYRKNL